MTGKATMTDSQGPGVRAMRAQKKRGLVHAAIFWVVAIALTVGLIMGTRDPAEGPPHFTPEAAVAGAILLPLLTLLTMWVTLRKADEVQRRLVVDAWAASLIVVMFGATSWIFLIGGGLVPEPPGPVVLIAGMGAAGASTMLAAFWLRWRRS